MNVVFGSFSSTLKWISVYSSLSFFFFKGDAFPFISDFLFFGFVAFSFIVTCVLSFLRSINLVPFPTFLMFRTEVHSTWWRYNRQTSGSPLCLMKLRNEPKLRRVDDATLEPNKINLQFFFGNLSSHDHRNYQMKLFSKSADFFYFQNTKPVKKLKPIIELNRSGVSVFVFTFSHDTKWHHEQKQPTQNHKGKSHLFKV